MTLDRSTLALTVGGPSVKLLATVSPADATDTTVTWSSSDSGVASVSKGVVAPVAAGTATITVTTTDGGKTAKCTVTVSTSVVAVTGVTLDRSTVSMSAGGATVQLAATIAPANATNPNVSWVSSSPAVATVSSSGLVSPVGAGTTTITVTTADGGKTAQCTVTVSANAVAVTSVTLDRSTLQMSAADAAVQLVATLAPENATNPNVTWASSNLAVATVSPSGLVSPVGAGTATITVTTADGGKTAQCAVTVNAIGTAVTSVTLDRSTLRMSVGDAAVQLVATVAPADATNPNVSWVSSDPAVATVSSSGQVAPVGPGTATITVTTADGEKTAQCTVTVVIPVTGVTLANATLNVTVSSSGNLSATISPANATDQAMTWSSDKPDVAEVDSSGHVTGKAVGTATITVTTHDGSHTATCQVTVAAGSHPVTGVTLDPTLNLPIGSTAHLTAIVMPADADNRNVTWVSSKVDVATVGNDGVVTGVGSGTAEITVTTTEGSFSAKCTVLVRKACPAAGVGKLTVCEDGPFVTANDVYSFEGAARDGANVNLDGKSYSDSCENDSFTYVAPDRVNQGQTFTTGSSATGYDITAVWVQHVGYTHNTTGSGNCQNGTWSSMAVGSNFTLRITDPSKAGDAGFAISRDTYLLTGSEGGNPAVVNDVNGVGWWIRFELAKPVTVNGSTKYGFDWTVNTGSFLEWLGSKDGTYAGGSAYYGGTAGQNGGPDNTLTALTGDRVFLVQMTPH